MKLYYHPGACSLADHIALAETGLAYALASVDLKARTVAGGGDYLAINPKGYVPALELDDGTVITENIAILSYIAERAGDLEPTAGIAHIRALEWLAYISTELHKNFKPYFNPAASDAEKDEAAEVLGKRFGYVAGKLDGRDFLLGDDFGVADCYLFVMLTWAEKNGIDLPPALAAYAARLKERPSVRKALAEEGIG